MAALGRSSTGGYARTSASCRPATPANPTSGRAGRRGEEVVARARDGNGARLRGLEDRAQHGQLGIEVRTESEAHAAPAFCPVRERGAERRDPQVRREVVHEKEQPGGAQPVDEIPQRGRADCGETDRRPRERATGPA